MWFSNETLYLDVDGNVVGAKDPARASKLVHAGCSIPLALAESLGLVAEPVVVDPEPALDVVAEDAAPVEGPVAEPETEKAVAPAKDKAVQPKKDKAK